MLRQSLHPTGNFLSCVDLGFDHFEVGLSVGVQKMVRSDLASSGVIFTLDTETGFRDVVFVTSAYGLGENVVQGRVAPDEFYVFKPTLRQGYRPLILAAPADQGTAHGLRRVGQQAGQERQRDRGRPQQVLSSATTMCSRWRSGR